MSQGKGIGSLLVTLGVDTRSIDKALGRAVGKFKSFGRNMKRLGATMSLSITAPLAAIGKNSFDVAAEFGLSMAKVQAVSGATANEFARLEANAKELGRTTIFTASDVAGLQLEFAKLGFTATEIEGVTAATLALAQATDSDLATAAEVAGATLRGFGLDVGQTSHVTDVMAAAFSSTALDMASFQDSMKYVAPVAAAAGISIEETTAMLGQMANAGIKGSQAGTSLRMIFQQMASGGNDVAEKMGELAAKGLTLDSAFDEVGRQAQTALLVLGENKSGVDDLANAFRNADGAAANMAAIMDNTSAGAMARMKSSIEGAQIALGTALAPTIEQISIVVGNVAMAFTNMSSGMRKNIMVISGIAAAIGPILVFLPQIIAGFTTIAGVITGPVLAAIAGVIAAIVLIRSNWDTIVDYFTNGDGAAMLESLKSMFIIAVDAIVATWDFLVTILVQLWAWFGTTITMALAGAFDFIVDTFKSAFDILTNVFGIFTAAFEGDWTGVWQRVVNVLSEAAIMVLRGVDYLISNLLKTIDFGLNALGFDSTLAAGWESMIGGAMEYLRGLQLEFEKTESVGASLFDTISSGFGLFGGGGGAAKPSTATTGNDAVMGDTAPIDTRQLVTGPSLMELVDLPSTGQFRGWFNQFNDELANSYVLFEMLAAGAEQMGQQFGDAFAKLITGAEGGREAMKSALSNIVDTAFKAATAHAIQAATATASNAGPAALILMPALIASGMALVRGVFQGLTGFADGGIVSGPVMGLVGEYAGARTNPEVIAPLNKLKSLIGDGGQHVVVTGRISGNDIVISNERSRLDRSRIRGF